ncbi:MAG: hydrogenase nickel incorporation protein HypB [Nitrosomonadales bacterium]|nr:hydrogenase nickel incorporation protein HypB [Nitrosomonadales bacterium]
MCTTCGCGGDDTLINGIAVSRRNLNRPSNRNGDASSAGRLLFRPHQQHHHHDPAPADTTTRRIQVEQNILAKNDALAADNRALFTGHNILALNLVSSPGSGKTTLLVRTIEALKGQVAMAVIEGDQQTDNDAERIRATGVQAIQINTGKGCHLDAEMVGHALKQMALPDGALLFIENVGNLVCPAAFDLGEAAKVVVLSVTEGEDKPLKYPDMFRAARLLLLNKCDLLPHLSFDIELAESHARRVNPDIEIIRLSATSGEGMQAWLDWLTAGYRNAVAGKHPA